MTFNTVSSSTSDYKTVIADCLNTKTANVIVCDAELKTITFTSDHGLMNENNDYWSDEGFPYLEPEWRQGEGEHTPISQSMATYLAINVKLNVKPSGMTFDLKGEGGYDWNRFVENGNTSTGSDQVVSMAADEQLPDCICIVSSYYDWTITLTNPNPHLEGDIGPSGPHMIYVTYGTPEGSVVTRKRINAVCTYASGLSTIEDC